MDPQDEQHLIEEDVAVATKLANLLFHESLRRRRWSTDLDVDAVRYRQLQDLARTCAAGAAAAVALVEARPVAQDAVQHAMDVDLPQPLPAEPLRSRREITAEEFQAKVGRAPENDDLNRCNCKQVLLRGHLLCGWCEQHDLPRFECAHQHAAARP
jgi:hypothetical protein